MPVVRAETAWQGLFTHGHLEKGQTILIVGGAGAVGRLCGAIRVACARRLHVVIATASGEDEAYVKSLGGQPGYRLSEGAQFEKVLGQKVDMSRTRNRNSRG